MKALAQGHRDNKQQSQNSNPDPQSPKALEHAKGIPELLAVSQARLLIPPPAKNTE